jgi:RHS repeat-associated protein
LNEYDGSDNFKAVYVYGNYIDEVLVKGSAEGIYNYIHDHLYSTVALLHGLTGVCNERYEYDAYGKPYILDSQYALRSTSSYGNNYLFTGREVDILDNGSLKIQNNRNRSYDYYTGRWLQRDPLGVNPAGGKENPFYIKNCYKDGLNLYEYVRSKPISNTDHFGLNIKRWWTRCCGGQEYNIVTSCCCCKNNWCEVVKRKSIPTGVKVCWINTWENPRGYPHEWIVVNGLSAGFYPTTSLCSRGDVNIPDDHVGEGHCQDIKISPCDYDFIAYRNAILNFIFQTKAKPPFWCFPLYVCWDWVSEALTAGRVKGGGCTVESELGG